MTYAVLPLSVYCEYAMKHNKWEIFNMQDMFTKILGSKRFARWLVSLVLELGLALEIVLALVLELELELVPEIELALDIEHYHHVTF